MARLIDADKLETDTVYATHLNHAESGYHYSYSEGAINEAPTVDAIPIEWLIEKYNNAETLGWGIDDWSEKDCYRFVLKRWEREKNG